MFYLSDDVIRGVLLWNVWDHVAVGAGQLIRDAKPTGAGEREAGDGVVGAGRTT